MIELKKNRTEIRSRVVSVIKASGLSNMQFSLAIGHAQSWAGMYTRNDQIGSLKAEDVLEMHSSLGVNPDYILFGKEPMFLEKR